MSRFLGPVVSFIFWLFYSCCVTDAAAVSRFTPRTDLGPILAKHAHKWTETTLSFPGSEEFVNATERWTTFSAPTYSAALTPATEDDLIDIVCE
jgi:hypothetical protein